MKTNFDDPRITDYFFSELGIKERVAFEKELAENPELSAAFEEFKAANAQFRSALEKEMEAFSLSENQRGMVKRAINEKENKPAFRFSFMSAFLNRPGLSFACALLVAGLCFLLVKDVVIVSTRQKLLAKEQVREQRAPVVGDVMMEPADQNETMAEPVLSEPAPPALAAANGPASGSGGEMAGSGAGSVEADGKSPVLGDIPITGRLFRSPTASTGIASLETSIPQRQGMAAGGGSAGINKNNLALGGYVEKGYIYPSRRAAIVGGAGEEYVKAEDNPFKSVEEEPLSTFSIDVDTASYTNLRRFLNRGLLPPPNAVRIEEMLNYFTYDYAQPQDESPFSIHVEVASCPWNSAHQLAHVGIQGRSVNASKRAPLNLVFLIDVSGSMSDENKLPLVKKGLKLLVKNLNPTDRVALVTYAGNSRLALPSTPASQRNRILQALEGLESGGSTNGEGGIRRAYDVAREHFIRRGINRVILATDGDFNVGVSNRSELVELIQAEARSGIYLNIFGFGMGNLKDATLEQLANKGNGIYGYIDSYQEARKVFADQVNSTLVTIAKDVKIQVEFNPAKVGAYRLIGYENRMLKKEDFNDDRKDAGEVGAGHSVTALYELIPPGESTGEGRVDPLKYQHNPVTLSRLTAAADSKEIMTLKLRYKEPSGGSSKLMKTTLADSGYDWAEASDNLRFSAAVAAFGMVLENSPYRGESDFALIEDLAGSALTKDPEGYRREFLQLVRKAGELK